MGRKPKPVYVTELRDEDVLFGRGSGPNDHIGNVTFRAYVAERKYDYNTTNQRAQKGQIAKEVIDKILTGIKGKFLKKLEPNEAYELGLNKGSSQCKTFYEVVTEEVAIEKAKQALRQNATQIVQKHTSSVDGDGTQSAFGCHSCSVASSTCSDHLPYTNSNSYRTSEDLRDDLRRTSDVNDGHLMNLIKNCYDESDSYCDARSLSVLNENDLEPDPIQPHSRPAQNLQQYGIPESSSYLPQPRGNNSSSYQWQQQFQNQSSDHTYLLPSHQQQQQQQIYNGKHGNHSTFPNTMLTRDVRSILSSLPTQEPILESYVVGASNSNNRPLSDFEPNEFPTQQNNPNHLSQSLHQHELGQVQLQGRTTQENNIDYESSDLQQMLKHRGSSSADAEDGSLSHNDSNGKLLRQSFFQQMGQSNASILNDESDDEKHNNFGNSSILNANYGSGVGGTNNEDDDADDVAELPSFAMNYRNASLSINQLCIGGANNMSGDHKAMYGQSFNSTIGDVADSMTGMSLDESKNYSSKGRRYSNYSNRTSLMSTNTMNTIDSLGSFANMSMATVHSALFSSINEVSEYSFSFDVNDHHSDQKYSQISNTTTTNNHHPSSSYGAGAAAEGDKR